MEQGDKPIADRKQRKHSSCSLREKLEVLHRIDNGESASKLAVEFSVGRATISDWKKNRHKLEKFSNTTSIETLERRHTSKKSPFDKVDEALYIWYMEEIEKGAHISGPTLQEKALQLNSLLQGENNFAASNGWLDRWKKRHGIRLHSMPSDRSADRAYKLNLWRNSSEFLSGYIPAGFDTAENATSFEELSQQESCTPDFKLSGDYFKAYSNGEHNLTFPARTKRKRSQSDDTDVLRERFKRQLAAAVKRYSVPESIVDTGTWDDKFVEVPEEILQLVKEVPQDCDKADVSEWVTADFPENLESADEPVFKSRAEDKDEAPVSNIAGARALEVALRYVQQHIDATPTDVMFMRRWRNIAAVSMLSDLRQKKVE